MLGRSLTSPRGNLVSDVLSCQGRIIDLEKHSGVANVCVHPGYQREKSFYYYTQRRREI